MKQFFRTILPLTFLLFFLFCLPTLVHAQPNPLCNPDDPYCPIDGGLTALLAIGVGYGIKKVRDSRNAESKRIKN